ncbi:neutral amino acid transporter [Allomyces javanicus]|nr:neutral amino acid transporter [Allomyces javanicus]
MGAVDAAPAGSASALRVFLLLLKSNIGTGALFLPSAFQDGGFAFSIVLLIVLAYLSTVGMVLLAKTNLIVPGSFEEMGKKIYGRAMHGLILGSVALSQIGFASAYTLFVASNTIEFVRRVTDGAVILQTWHLILIQLCLYIPFAMVRQIKNFAAFSLMGNVFVLFGLGVIVYTSIAQIATHGVGPDIMMFNSKHFALFIGTAVYTYEGVGLVVPVAQSMKNPQRFPLVLSLALVVTTMVYLVVASCGYLAFGSNIKTIALFNLPEGPFSSSIYILYIIAIVLSWPLILFPATVIVQGAILPPVDPDSKQQVRGANWSPTKRYWAENGVRTCLVLFVAGIAWVAGDKLNLLVSLIGGFGCVPLSFIYPALLHMKTFPEQGVFGRFMDWFLVVVGTVSTVYVTVMTFV